MSKRFTDTNKYKKPFIRGLPGPYKLLWDYIYHDCDHAGVWHVDFEIAQIYLGKDMPVEADEAIRLFNAGEVRVVPFDSGNKWYLPTFVEFQYGDLNPDNRVHASILAIISRHNLQAPRKPLTSSLEGLKDKDKDKDMVKDKDKTPIGFDEFWAAYPRKLDKSNAMKKYAARLKDGGTPVEILEAAKKYLATVKDPAFIRHPATFLNSDWRQWLTAEVQATEKPKYTPPNKEWDDFTDEEKREYRKNNPPPEVVY